jgi:polysaccharide deacetylase 2 family uncharacterized protein YibQ
VPKTSNKTAKRTTAPQAKKQPRKRAAGRGRRTKKAVSRDFSQALLLTAGIIGVAALISVAAIKIKTPAPDMPFPAEITETPTPENPPIQNPPLPDELTAVNTPQERQTPATTAPENKRESATANKKAEQNRTTPPTTRAPTTTPAAVPARQPTTTFASPVSVPARNTPPAKTPAPTAPSVPMAPPLEAALPPMPPPKHQGTLVFVIDDAGNNLQELEPFLRFPGPLTIAVLPGLPHSAEAARRIRAAGKEVFLHQPMEAIGGQNPGPGAIYAEMDTAEVLAILKHNIAEIGPIAGMNNHQGSKITMDRQIMETVLTFCREQGILFLDSRTTAETVVPAVAQNLSIKIGERNIFIDNDQSRPAMNRSIEGGLTLASRRGSSVMIGHTWSPELAPLLTELYQNFIAQGYTFATASEIIKR